MSQCIMSICSGRNSGLGLFLPFFFSHGTQTRNKRRKKRRNNDEKKKEKTKHKGG